MGSEKITEDTTITAPAKDAPALVKKIGRTTYIVRVHFSKTSRERCKNDNGNRPGFRNALAPGL